MSRTGTGREPARAGRHGDYPFERAFTVGGVAAAVISPRGEFLDVNAPFCDLTGYRRGELLTRTVPDLIPPELEQRDMAAIERCLEDPDATLDLRTRVVTASGEQAWVHITSSLIRDATGEPEFFVAQAVDISAEVFAEQALAESRQRFRSAFEAAPVGMALTDLDGVLLQVNSAFCDIVGYSAGELFELATPDSITHVGDLAGFRLVLDRIRSGDATAHRMQLRYVHKDGHDIWVELALTAPRAPDGCPLYVISQILDISEQQELVESLRAGEKRLEFQVSHDQLTSLPNRRMLVDRINELRARHHPGSVTLLLVDLDEFKLVNDSFGHRTGDELLKLAAQRLRSLVRESDLVCRMGGDEFAVLVSGLDSVHEILALAHRVTEHMSVPFVVCGQELFVSASTGIAEDPGGGLDPEDLIANADVAMYQAKDGGRCRFQVFDEVMRARIADRQETDTALRKALGGDELSVHYQPVVDLRTGRAVGCEALLRWNWPGVGEIPPEQFIPVAERNGVIVPLGSWVLQNSCEQLNEWRGRWPDADLTMSVNVSGRQLTHPDVVESFAAILEDTGVPTDRVQLELTESVLLDDFDSVLGTISSLRRLGIQLALDDFGTGYSSLTHMQQLDFEVLKLDRSFMHRITSSHVDETIVRTLITMAAALGRTVVAEGVETEPQRRKLSELGCRLAQGFLFARPQAPSSIDSLLEELILEPRPLTA
ncbi:MAG: hypothetical protein JJLCMIEE_03053 [Acidimicrobiales bacterium]|nr:hypothetical protein [Acidimicrobiales bacterium]